MLERSKGIGLNKPCCIQDFDNPELLHIMRSLLPKPACESTTWPKGMEDRKFWEIAMAILSMMRHLPVDRRCRSLGVGAGIEVTSHIFTQYFKQVFATDLYGGRQWMSDAPLLMLARPEEYACGVAFNKNRLVVQHMDGRDLRYEEGWFDFIYSSSSIEHFGGVEDIQRSASEMGRVLAPGGIISLSTELLLSGGVARLNDTTLLLSKEHIVQDIIEASGCEPVDEVTFEITEETLSHIQELNELAKESLLSHERLCGSWQHYPHLLITHQGVTWTSMHLCLRKLSNRNPSFPIISGPLL